MRALTRAVTVRCLDMLQAPGKQYENLERTTLRRKQTYPALKKQFATTAIMALTTYYTGDSSGAPGGNSKVGASQRGGDA